MDKKTKLKAAFGSSDILAALERTGGNLTQAAALLKTSRATIYDRIKRDPKILRELRSVKETLIDQAESLVAERLKAGDLRAAFFVLKHYAASTRFPLSSVEQQEEIADLTF